MDLTEKILFYMKRYHMIPENKNIVVGLSGGADSVCLLYVLAALRKKLGLQKEIRTVYKIGYMLEAE